ASGTCGSPHPPAWPVLPSSRAPPSRSSWSPPTRPCTDRRPKAGIARGSRTRTSTQPPRAITHSSVRCPPRRGRVLVLGAARGVEGSIHHSPSGHPMRRKYYLRHQLLPTYPSRADRSLRMASAPRLAEAHRPFPRGPRRSYSLFPIPYSLFPIPCLDFGVHDERNTVATLVRRCESRRRTRGGREKRLARGDAAGTRSAGCPGARRVRHH